MVLSCCSPLRKSDIPDRLQLKRFYGSDGDWINVGDSAIVSPDGEYLAGPIREKEVILYADLDPVALQGPHWLLDVAGHYARPDVFELSVNIAPNSMIATNSTSPASSLGETGPASSTE